MVQVIIEKEKPTSQEEKLEGKKAVLAVLARAVDDSKFLARLADNPSKALTGYYTLNSEELVALTSGDIKKIGSWCGKLDKEHTTWLWCRLSREKR